MCNDYERHIEWAAFEAALAEAKLGIAASASPTDLPSAGDVRVNDTSPILVASGNIAQLTPMRWGFAPQRAGGPPVFNFRSENRDFTQSNRCIIPASAFFEFTGKSSPKTKWRFELGEAPVLGVAGLWRQEKCGAAFTMLTTAPGPDVEPYHDRQICVLPAARWGHWLYLHEPKGAPWGSLPKGSLRISLAREGRDTISPSLLEHAL